MQGVALSGIFHDLFAIFEEFKRNLPPKLSYMSNKVSRLLAILNDLMLRARNAVLNERVANVINSMVKMTEAQLACQFLVGGSQSPDEA